MICYVRHGERADKSDDPNEIKKIVKSFDVHLTNKGEVQAQITGKYLKGKIREREMFLNDKCQIKIVTSPFLRCIMTAINLTKQLESVKQIYLQEQIGELMYIKDFDSNILGDIHIRSSSFEKLNQEYIKLDDINLIQENLLKDESLIQPIYPEYHDYCKNRIKSFHDLVVKQIQLNEIYICVTHQGMVDLISEIHERPMPFNDYCAITSTIVNIEKKQSIIELEAVCAWKQQQQQQQQQQQ